MGHDDREGKFEKALERHLRQGELRDASAAAHSQAEPACPDAAQLAAFHERMLSNEEMDVAKAHIAACPRCQEILALLEATDEVVSHVADTEEKALEFAEPMLAGRPRQEGEYFPQAAAPVFAARPTAASKAPQSILTGRRARVWRWVAPAAAVAAGLLIWVTTRDTLQHSKKAATGIQVAQEEKSERQLADQVTPLPPASLPAETPESRRLDEALKSLNESKGSSGLLSARRAPASTLGGGVGGAGGGAGIRSEETIRELPLQGRNSALNKAALAKPAGRAASRGDVSVTAAAPSVNTNAAEFDKAPAKDRKKADSPAAPADAPASRVGGNAAPVSGGQNARDSNRKILQKEKLEPGVSAALSASSAPSPQPAAPPPAAARTAAKQNADAVEKKEAGANAMTGATTQTEVTANYEHSSDLQNSRVGLAKTSEAGTNSKMKDWQLIPTPGGTVLWRLRAGGKIERSVDRGINWSQQNTGVKLELLAGSAPSDAVCWLVGRKGTILRTTDGGGHWSKIVSPLTGDVGGIRAEDAQRATIFDTGNNTRLTTSDGGATWTPAKE